MSSENDLTGKIGLDTTEFKRGITELNKQIKSIETGFRASAAVMDDWSSSTSGLQGRVTSLSEKLDLQKKKLNTLHEEYDKLKGAEGDNSKAMASLADKMYSAEKAITSTKKDLDKYTAALKDAQKEEKESNSSMGKLKKSFADLSESSKKTASSVKTHFSGIKSAFLGALAVLGTQASVGGIISMAEEAEKPMSQLDSVLKSTGGSAGVTKQAVLDLSSSLSKQTKFAADDVTSAQDMLLTFTNIGSDVFPQATESVLDMSQAMGQDWKSSATMLGKALNDPTAGLSALTRVGVTFTDAQKKQIKAMQDAGDTAGAQKLILQELQKEFGGSAKAAGEDFSGQLTIAKNSIHDAGEEASLALIPIITNIMPGIVKAAQNLAGYISSHKAEIQGAIQKAQEAIKKVFDFIQQHGPAIKIAIEEIGAAFVAWKVASTIGSAIKALNEFKEAQKATTLAQGILNAVMSANPIGLIVIAIGVLIATFVILWNNCEGFRNFWIGLWDKIKSAAQAVGDWFSGPFIDFFKNAWSGIQEAFSAVGSWFSNTFGAAWNGIKSIWSGVSNWFGGVWSKIISVFKPNLISDGFKNAWGAIQGVWNAVGAWFGNVWNSIISHFQPNMISDVFAGAWSAIQGVWSGVAGWFQGIWDGIIGVFKSGINFILSGINVLISGLDRIHFDFPDWVPGVGGKGFGISIPKIPLLAEGGIVDKATLAMIGEAGKEAVVPLERNAGWIKNLANDLATALNRASTVATPVQTLQPVYAAASPSAQAFNFYQYNTSPKALTPSETARQTRNILRQARLKSR